MKSTAKSATSSASSPEPLEEAIDGLLTIHSRIRGLAPAAGWLAAGDIVGSRYRILRPLGEGGMGEVFLAEQIEPVRRQVALKVIKPGMETRSLLRRFAAERQVLALMGHPYIARIYDGGTTAAGRPYLVMEYVPGIPITDYCQQNGLGVRERLALFLDACSAVEHAHNKGVIHRDLKPSNLLVTQIASHGPSVKVIDFGIAKTAAPETARANTVTGQLFGTPRYMSPEHLAGGAPVDHRTDVYSLGAILFELLGEEAPFHRAMFETRPFDEICRIVRQEPLKLCSPSAIHGLRIQKPLARITSRAVAKHPDARYPSAKALAEDIGRFLQGERIPILKTLRLSSITTLLGRPSTWAAALGMSTLTSLALFLFADLDAGATAADPMLIIDESFENVPAGPRQLPHGWTGAARTDGFIGQVDFGIRSNNSGDGQCLYFTGETMAGSGPDRFWIGTLSAVIPGPLPSSDLEKLQLTISARGSDPFNVVLFRIESATDEFFTTKLGFAQFTTTVSPSRTTMGGPLSQAGYLKNFDPAAPFHRIAIHVNQNTWNFDSGNFLEIDHMRLEYRR